MVHGPWQGSGVLKGHPLAKRGARSVGSHPEWWGAQYACQGPCMVQMRLEGLLEVTRRVLLARPSEWGPEWLLLIRLEPFFVLHWFTHGAASRLSYCSSK